MVLRRSGTITRRWSGLTRGRSCLRRLVQSILSAGGQFVTRYQMANQVDGTLGVPITYVVANPSAYPYLDNERPVPASADYRPYADPVNCTTFDSWPYGLKDRWGYAREDRR
jgi:hypothetical protein